MKIDLNELLDEAKRVRARVSGYSDKKKASLSKKVRRFLSTDAYSKWQRGEIDSKTYRKMMDDFEVKSRKVKLMTDN